MAICIDIHFYMPMLRLAPRGQNKCKRYALLSSQARSPHLLPWGFLRPPEWRMRGERVGVGSSVGALEGLARDAGGPGWCCEN